MILPGVGATVHCEGPEQFLGSAAVAGRLVLSTDRCRIYALASTHANTLLHLLALAHRRRATIAGGLLGRFASTSAANTWLVRGVLEWL